MNLYEIDQAILRLVDPDTGEILDWDAFDKLKMERGQKIENMACWYKNLVAEAKAIRQEELNLAERRRNLEAMAEKRKMWLFDVLGGEKFQTARCAVSFRKTTKVEIMDEGAAIEWAHRNNRDDLLKFTEPTVKKDELTKLLKDGTMVPGAELVTGLSMGVK